LLTFEWILTGTAILVALVAFARARQTARRLERLTESYWELRYEIAQLRARVIRLNPEQDAAATDPEPPAAPAATAFVPLSSLKRGRL
jgi:hypothetical protein